MACSSSRNCSELFYATVTSLNFDARFIQSGSQRDDKEREREPCLLLPFRYLPHSCAFNESVDRGAPVRDRRIPCSKRRSSTVNTVEAIVPSIWRSCIIRRSSESPRSRLTTLLGICPGARPPTPSSFHLSLGYSEYPRSVWPEREKLAAVIIAAGALWAARYLACSNKDSVAHGRRSGRMREVKRDDGLLFVRVPAQGRGNCKICTRRCPLPPPFLKGKVRAPLKFPS